MTQAMPNVPNGPGRYKPRPFDKKKLEGYYLVASTSRFERGTTFRSPEMSGIIMSVLLGHGEGRFWWSRMLERKVRWKTVPETLKPYMRYRI